MTPEEALDSITRSQHTDTMSASVGVQTNTAEIMQRVANNKSQHITVDMRQRMRKSHAFSSVAHLSHKSQSQHVRQPGKPEPVFAHIGCLPPGNDYLSVKTTAVLVHQMLELMHKKEKKSDRTKPVDVTEMAGQIPNPHLRLAYLLDVVFCSQHNYNWLKTAPIHNNGEPKHSAASALHSDTVAEYKTIVEATLKQIVADDARMHADKSQTRPETYSRYERRALKMVVLAWHAKQTLSCSQLAQVLYGLCKTVRVSKAQLGKLLSAMIRLDMLADAKTQQKLGKYLETAQPCNPLGEVSLLNTCALLVPTLVVEHTAPRPVLPATVTTSQSIQAPPGRIVSRSRPPGGRRRVLPDEHTVVQLLADYTKALINEHDTDEAAQQPEPQLQQRMRRALYDYERTGGTTRAHHHRSASDHSSGTETHEVDLEHWKERINCVDRALTPLDLRDFILALTAGWAVTKRAVADRLKQLADDEIVDANEFKQMLLKIRLIAPGRTTVPMQRVVHVLDEFVKCLLLKDKNK